MSMGILRRGAVAACMVCATSLSFVPAGHAQVGQGYAFVRAMTEAAARCDKAAYGSNRAALVALINQQKAASPEQFMLEYALKNAQVYPNPCPPTESGSASASGYERFAARRLDAMIQLNNDFFIGGSLGGMGASTNQTLAGQNTGGADAVPSIVQTITPGSLSGGVVAGFNGPVIDISGFRFIPGVVGSVEWMDASGTAETILNVGAVRVSTANTITDHSIVTVGGRLLIGSLPGTPATSGFVVPFVEGGEAWVNKSVAWHAISGPPGLPPLAEQKNLHLASPYLGAGLTTAPFTFMGVPMSVTGQVNHIFPTGNTLVSFGNPATLSQSFFVRQSITEAKLSVTVPVSDFWAQGINVTPGFRY